MPSRRELLLSTLGLALSGCMSRDNGVLTDHEPEQNLLAGAGKAWVSFDQLSWPIAGYDSVHDAPGARVIILHYDAVRVAIVVLDMTSIPGDFIATAKSLLMTQAQVAAENCFICASHTFSVPGIRPSQHLANTDKALNTQLSQCYLAALTQAISDAVKQLQPAKLGFGQGTSFVNINRDQHYDNGWWLGRDKDGFSDPRLGMLRIDDIHGKPLAALFNYAVQSSVTDGAVAINHQRQISGDLAGMASRYLETHSQDDLVAFFMIGGAGDQAPRLQSVHNQIEKGKAITRQYSADPFALLTQLSENLGQDALRVLQSIETGSIEALSVERQVFELPAVKFTPENSPQGPVTHYNYSLQGVKDFPVTYLIMGEAVWVGVQPEFCAQTAANIRKNSPFRYTFISTLVDGAAKYLPDQRSFERMTYEARSSFYAAGSAEKVSSKIIDTLHRLKQKGSQ